MNKVGNWLMIKFVNVIQTSESSGPKTWSNMKCFGPVMVALCLCEELVICELGSRSTTWLLDLSTVRHVSTPDSTPDTRAISLTCSIKCQSTGENSYSITVSYHFNLKRLYFNKYPVFHLPDFVQWRQHFFFASLFLTLCSDHTTSSWSTL